MTESLCAAVVQLQSGDDVSANLAEARQLVERAAAAGAQIVVLPENFAYFGAESEKPQHAETLGANGPIQDMLQNVSVKTGACVVAGGMPEQSSVSRRPYNTAVVVSPSGIVASYRKVHLFDVDLPVGKKLQESSGTSAGDAVVVADVLGVKIGLSICYDVRFPKLYQALIDGGAEVLAVPAAFTEQTGKDHWHVLLRARAIECQCYVLAAAQWGRHPESRRSYGHALIADPWGTVVAECSDSVGYALTELDLEYLRRVRTALPCLSHRRGLNSQ